MTKDELRKEILRKRSQLSLEKQAEKSNSIYEKLISLDEYKNSDWIFTYINMGAEVRTVPLIEKAWRDGKRVAVPVAKSGRLMYFIEIKDFENLTKTKMGVSEPSGDLSEQVLPTEKTMFIVPGSVFDENKNRCGYGGGYYDTYTEEKNVAETIGVCYEMQVMDKIPVEPFDRKVFKLVTEKRIIE